MQILSLHWMMKNLRFLMSVKMPESILKLETLLSNVFQIQGRGKRDL